MRILSQLEEPAFRPSKGDKLVLEYLRANARQVPNMPISKLAAACRTGVSTVTRFVKKMGFSSMQQFKVALTAELAENSHTSIINSDIEAGEPALATGRKLLAANISTLERTLEAMPEGLIEACAARLLSAKRIKFIGLGNSGFTARDSAYKFYRIGLESAGLDNGHDMAMMAALARPGDVVVAVSQSGASEEILQTLAMAHERGACCMMVTANEKAPELSFLEACILYKAKESLLETGSISAKLAQFFVMDLLYTQVVKQMPEQALENKKLTAEAVSHWGGR